MKIKNRSRALLILLSLVMLVLCTLPACSSAEKADELALGKFIIMFHEQPEDLEILTLKRYKVSSHEYYYYVEWRFPLPAELAHVTERNLIASDTNTDEASVVHLHDMEMGMYPQVKRNWEKVKDSDPDKVFTAEEITELKSKIIESMKAE